MAPTDDHDGRRARPGRARPRPGGRPETRTDRGGQRTVTSTTAAPKVSPERGQALHAEILLIGRDLLRGRVADRNGPLLTRSIAETGGIVHRVTVVDDVEHAVERALREALSRNPHLVVMCGGTGPAADDVTLAAVATVLGRPLVANPAARAMVEAGYRRLHRARVVTSAGLTAARERLCRLPVGCTLLENPHGLQPGTLHRLPGGAAIACLPGTPSQARATFERAVEELHDLLPHKRMAQREVEAPTADESEMRPLVDRVLDEFPGASVSTRPSSGGGAPRVIVVLETTAASVAEAESVLDAIEHRILQLAGGG